MAKQTRNSKSKRGPTAIRPIVANNVRLLRDHVFRDLGTETKQNEALAAAIGSRLSQIQRILNCEVGTSIDNVEALAAALNVRPQDLLTPYFANQALQRTEASADPFAEPMVSTVRAARASS